MNAGADGAMARPVHYCIIDCPDGRFAVVASLSSVRPYWRGGFRTLAEADACIEELRWLMEACGAPLVRRDDEVRGVDLNAVCRSHRPPG